MNDSAISFDTEFKNQEKTIQSTFFQTAYSGESSGGLSHVLSMKLSFVLASSAIFIDLLHGRKLLPVSGAETSIIPGLSEYCNCSDSFSQIFDKPFSSSSTLLATVVQLNLESWFRCTIFQSLSFVVSGVWFCLFLNKVRENGRKENSLPDLFYPL